MSKLNTKVEGCERCSDPTYPVPHYSCAYVAGGGGHAGHERGHCTADICW